MHYLRNLEEGEASPNLEAMVGPGDRGWDVPPAEVQEVEGFFGHLEQVLVDVDFHRRNNPRQLMTRLRRLFQRARLDQMEINILRGILTSVQKAAGTLPGSDKQKNTADEGQEKGHV
jgi:tRNA (cytidine32/uridine32-2'-O)-methyltransferase